MPNLILSCAIELLKYIYLNINLSIEMLKYIYLNINLAIFFNLKVSCHVHCIK